MTISEGIVIWVTVCQSVIAAGIFWIAISLAKAVNFWILLVDTEEPLVGLAQLEQEKCFGGIHASKN